MTLLGLSTFMYCLVVIALFQFYLSFSVSFSCLPLLLCQQGFYDSLCVVASAPWQPPSASKPVHPGVAKSGTHTAQNTGSESEWSKVSVCVASCLVYIVNGLYFHWFFCLLNMQWVCIIEKCHCSIHLHNEINGGCFHSTHVVVMKLNQHWISGVSTQK